MPQLVINKQIYADIENSSTSEFEPKFSGKVVWDAPSCDSGIEPQMIQCLAIINGALLTKYVSSAVLLRSRFDGKYLESKKFVYDTKFAIVEDAFAGIEKGGEVSLFSIDCKVKRNAMIPLFLNSSLSYIELYNDEIRYVLNHFPQQSSGPGPVAGPRVNFIRFDLNTQSFLFLLERNGFLQDIVFSKTESCYYLLIDYSVLKVPGSAKDDADVQKLSLGQIHQIALTNAGAIATVNQKDGVVSLQMHNGKQSNPLWICELPSSVIIQPPSAVSESKVYTVSGNQLICVDNGKISWSDTLPCVPGEAYFTVIKKSNSVLVAAGNALVHYLEDGSIKNRIFLETPLSCRPIIDEKGMVYVGGKVKVYCIE